MRRRVATLVLALLAALLAAVRRARRRTRAIGAPADGAGRALPSAAPEAEIAGAKAADQDVPQPQVEGESSPVPRFLSLPWTADPDPPSPGATAFRVRFALLPGRMALARVDVRETPSQVFVTVLARWDPAAGAARSAARQDGFAEVRLARPLGDRALVHAPPDELPGNP